jgi:flavin-dependent dehydrogenase
MKDPQTIAILGGGPSGAGLAAWLARGGRRVVLFDPGKRPPLIVGESLIPAVMPYLFDLGIADEVKAYSTLKPGATFLLDRGRVVHSFRFDQVPGAKCTYAYNVPRERYDATFRAAAQRLGATVLSHRAKVERVPGTDRLRLSDDTVTAAGDALGGSQPDLIVDATGRVRTVAKLLDLGADEGPRRDVALFAHCTGVDVVDAGHVHTEVTDWGWAWRIPLQGRVSVGFVLDARRAARFGDTDEERFDNLLKQDSQASTWGVRAERVTPVVRYNNWSLVARRGVGENWALVGDAFGFVDPVFSSGMMLALTTAKELAGVILDEHASDAALQRYEQGSIAHVHGWQEAVETFYNGKLWAILEVGTRLKSSTLIGRLVAPHFERNIPKVFTGEAARNPHAMRLIRTMCRYGLVDVDVARYAVHV